MSDSPWFLSYVKLRFFVLVRQFLKNKRGKSSGRFDQWNVEKVEEIKIHEEEEEKEEEEEEEISIEKVNLELLVGKEREEIGVDKGLSQLQRSVKQLHFGNYEDKRRAAEEIKRLAKHDLQTRKSLASLAVIPTLVSMLDSDFHDHRRSALQALIELSNGTYTNKALMVEAGILAKLPELLNTSDQEIKEEFAIILLSISSLANTQFSIATSEILPFLIGILDSGSPHQACLATVYNLSTMLENTEALVSNGVVHTLLKLSTEQEASERALATLGNLAVPVAGKKAMETDPLVPKNLMEILTWENKPRCQELAAYILMILAHRSSVQRDKMGKAGIVQILLEVALLGSPLAQKRALRILQWFRDERKTAMAAHSGPQAGVLFPASSPVNQRMTKEGKMAIKRMVKQSLDKNMEHILKRANGGCSGAGSKLKNLAVSSSSKSLPY